jgi:HD-GYP domain-containing protein (c-di-GMP phosphodiesterase class II)
MLVEHDIADIRVGMYVIEITEPKNKFRLTNPTWIENELVIEALKRKSVEKLLVDTSKTRVISADNDTSTVDADNTHAADAVKAKANKTNANNAMTALSPLASKSAFHQDIIKARRVFDESKNIQKKLFHNAQHGLPLEMEPVHKITAESTDMIFNNPDALACVINIRHKDEYLLEHSVSVSVLMTMFAVFMKIDKETVNQLAIGAFLHDVGKIMIPDSILNKPGKLTDSEFDVMKSHASHSIKIMRQTPGISALSLEVASQHHEKLNGKGYPLGLDADNISLYGRMISICDIFDALTATRCYKQGYPQVKAFSILRTLADNNELDKALVDSFIKCMGVYPVGSVVQLDSNRLALVENRNLNDPIRPNVRPFYRLDPKHFEIGHNIDLSTVTDEQIVRCVHADDFDLNMDEIMEFLDHEA